MVRTLRMSIVLFVFGISYNLSAEDTCLKASAISGGEYHTLTLMEDKTVWACGSDSFGQLGNGNDGSSTILVSVHDGEMNTSSGFLENIIAVDAGWYHSLAFDEDGYIYAWGGDNYGQIGNGSYNNNIL